MFALDTNVIIHFLKGKGRVVENLLAQSPKDVFIPSIVYYELLVGVEKSANPVLKRQILDTLLSHIQFLEFGEKESLLAAKIRAKLENSGQTIGPYDILIAATALSHNMTLVTHNSGEFKRVDRLEITDWF